MTNIVTSASQSQAGSVLSELFYEKETEYYGMTPYALLDRIGSTIVDQYFITLNNLQNELLPKSCPFLSETQIAAALTQWSLLVEGTIDKNFELFETYIMKNILALPGDFPIDFEEGNKPISVSQSDLKSLQDQMELITRRLESVRTQRAFFIINVFVCVIVYVRL